MQDGGVRLRRAGPDIVSGIDDHAAQVILRDGARDRGADHAGTDDQHIYRIIHCVAEITCRTMASNADRRSAASSGLILGSTTVSARKGPTAALRVSYSPTPTLASAATPSAVASAVR